MGDFLLRIARLAGTGVGLALTLMLIEYLFGAAAMGSFLGFLVLTLFVEACATLHDIRQALMRPPMMVVDGSPYRTDYV